MRVLVCGGRDYTDAHALDAALNSLSPAPTLIIHGAARGADTLADAWAKEWGVSVLAFPADWHRDGRAAGPIRNARMLAEGRPDLVVALPGGRGTADMVRRARAAGLRVVEVG